MANTLRTLWSETKYFRWWPGWLLDKLPIGAPGLSPSEARNLNTGWINLMPLGDDLVTVNVAKAYLQSIQCNYRNFQFYAWFFALACAKSISLSQTCVYYVKANTCNLPLCWIRVFNLAKKTFTFLIIYLYCLLRLPVGIVLLSGANY